MKKELKKSELNKISGGGIQETKDGKWEFYDVWGIDQVIAEFDTKEEAEEYEKRLEKIKEKCQRRDAHLADFIWFDRSANSQKNKK